MDVDSLRYWFEDKVDAANTYLFKVNNRNTRKRCEVCPKLTIKTPEWRHWHRFDVFIVNFEHISHLFVVLYIVNFKQVNVSWVYYLSCLLIYYYNAIFHKNKKRLETLIEHPCYQRIIATIFIFKLYQQQH